MYVGIDVGGTKTLAAVLDDDGQINQNERFPTSPDYQQFLTDLKTHLDKLPIQGPLRVCMGVPGLLDRKQGQIKALGNLPWGNQPIASDVSKLLDNAPVIIENDAKLAGLSEAQLIKDQYRNVLFLTVSTGIGGAVIIDGQILKALQNMEVGKMPLLHGETFVNWEEFAGGRSVVKRFNKKAFEITDPEIWKQIGETFAYGLAPLCAVLQPEVVVLGGSVGAHANQFSSYVMDFLKANLHPVIERPKAILAAQRPDDAVLYGCYDLAKQTYEQ